MAYKIIAQRSSFLERSITFEVDGKLDTISAPSANATFEDLIAKIEERFGSKKTNGTEPKEEPAEVEESKEADAEPEPVAKTTASKSRKKSSKSAAE